MRLLDLCNQPARRRQWLLFKALEAAPLDEALRMAEAAEAFLTTGRGTYAPRLILPAGITPCETSILIH
jgi:hypothetical protein